jgi:hypothetical protein
LALVQVKTPARDMPTVAAVQLPGCKVIVPRSRFCTDVSVSGLMTVAWMDAFWVTASAGEDDAAIHAAPAANKDRTVLFMSRLRLPQAPPAFHQNGFFSVNHVPLKTRKRAAGIPTALSSTEAARPLGS